MKKTIYCLMLAATVLSCKKDPELGTIRTENKRLYTSQEYEFTTSADMSNGAVWMVNDVEVSAEAVGKITFDSSGEKIVDVVEKPGKRGQTSLAHKYYYIRKLNESMGSHWYHQSSSGGTSLYFYDAKIKPISSRRVEIEMYRYTDYDKWTFQVDIDTAERFTLNTEVNYEYYSTSESGTMNVTGTAVRDNNGYLKLDLYSPQGEVHSIYYVSDFYY